MKTDRVLMLRNDLLKSEIASNLSQNMDIGVKKLNLRNISKTYLDIYLNNNDNLDFKEFEKFKNIKIEKKINKDKNHRKVLLESLNDLINSELKQEKLNINNVINLFKIVIETNYIHMEKEIKNEKSLNETKENFYNKVMQYVEHTYLEKEIELKHKSKNEINKEQSKEISFN